MKAFPSPVPSRPVGGWLKHHRQQRELSLQAVADRLDVSPQAVHQFEKSEMAGTISLRQLAAVARAVGCRLNYELAPIKPAKARTPAPSPTLVPALRPAALAAALRSEPAIVVDTERFSVTTD
jgi:transcriptional regulator with XRE-family HTH domain